MPDPTRATCDTADKPAKKSYEPPRILSRERLEAVAALCSLGKANGVGDCANISNS